MKPVPAIISGNAAANPVFLIREIKQPYFDSEFHFHEECQLVYIIKGSGKRIVGDSVEYFSENDLVFLGPDIPHVWHNAGGGAHPAKHTISQSLSLFIAPGRLGEFLAAFGEAHKTAQLFARGQRGMLITGQTRHELIALLKKAATLKGIPRIVVLLQVLNALTITREYTFLASAAYENTLQFRDNDRMSRVYRYLLENFQNDIQLNEVAAVAGITPPAFCRYFKSRTQKSCTRFINELRIGYACKLLTEKDDNIMSVAFECGFNNLSNFNRSFKMIKKISPAQYRREFAIN